MLAGGGFKAGHVHGATDEFGYSRSKDRVSCPDLLATILTSSASTTSSSPTRTRAATSR